MVTYEQRAFRVEPERMTRACTIVPVIKRNASATQSHERSSRATPRPMESRFMAAGLFFGALRPLDLRGGHGHFDLHVFGMI